MMHTLLNVLNAELVQSAREKRGYSQESLAEELGVTRLTVWRWENHPPRQLDYGTAQRLSEVLGVPADDLHVGNGSDPGSGAPETTQAHPDRVAAVGGPDSGGT